MKGAAPRVRIIEGRGSWRTRAFNALPRLASGAPLREDTDIGALRRRYEELDARHFTVDRLAVREPVVCDGVAAEWVSVSETRPERTLLYLHGGSRSLWGLGSGPTRRSDRLVGPGSEQGVAPLTWIKTRSGFYA